MARQKPPQPMRWKLKAVLQNAIATLPSWASYAIYYWVQRHLGSLREFNPESRLRAAVETWTRIENAGVDPTEKVFFEVGTGRVPVVPFALWLMGAKRTISVDVNPYLQPDLVQELLLYVKHNTAAMWEILGTRLRFDRLKKVQDMGPSVAGEVTNLLEMWNIAYDAPADATSTGLPDDSVDFHTSYTVLEHIPRDALKRILQEGNRISRRGGLFVHRIDYTDHFAHTDPTISKINFLQYSERSWNCWAGNRFMYMNRLRHDDYVDLFEEAGHEMVAVEPDVDESLSDILADEGFDVDRRFAGKSARTLLTTGSWFVSRLADVAAP